MSPRANDATEEVLAEVGGKSTSSMRVERKR